MATRPTLRTAACVSTQLHLACYCDGLHFTMVEGYALVVLYQLSVVEFGSHSQLGV